MISISAMLDPRRPIWQHVALSTLFGVLACFSLLSILNWIAPEILSSQAQVPDNFLLYTAKVLIIAPVIENIVLSLYIELLRAYFDKTSAIATICGLTFGLLHFISSPPLVVAGSIMFSMMALSYMLFSHRSYFTRMSIITAQHALFNLVGLLGFV